MPKSVTVTPLWSDAVMPDPRLLLRETEHLHLAPASIERAIGRLKDEQAERLEQLERELGKVRIRPTTRVRPAGPRPVRRPRPQQPVAHPIAAAVDVLAGIHPLMRADVLKRCGGDLRRLKVLGPDKVVVLNRPCDES
jgi:hypothetical protein